MNEIIEKLRIKTHNEFKKQLESSLIGHSMSKNKIVGKTLRKRYFSNL